jgi:hypothetical protein
MTARKFFSFPLLAAAINRAYRMNYVFSGQLSACSDDGLSRRQAPNPVHNLPAFGEDGRSASAVNSAIYSTAAQKR